MESIADSTEPFILLSGKPLNPRDIYAQRFSADLVVLAACETGKGKNQRGEGILSLGRGFAYAGVPSVLSTLWEARSGVTLTLTGFFLGNYFAGMPADEALYQAKLRMLKNPPDGNASPYFWAGFTGYSN